MLDTEFIPARERDSHRLMIVLHGLGDSVEGYRWLPQALGLRDLNFLLVNAPDEYYGGFSWYDIPGDATPGVRRSRALLNELLDAQPARGFAPEQTLLFGFSQGCLMTLETGLRYPQRLAGLIGVSGYLHDPKILLQEMPTGAREQRVLVTHGHHDPMIPIAKVRAQIQSLQAAGLPIEWREFAKEHTIAGEAELEVIRDFVTACLAK